MKFRYLLTALFLCLAVGCVEEELGFLSEMQLSESYVAIDVNGGSASISANANTNWTVVESSVPSWLTVSPMSGSAGESKITFSAGSTKATNEADVQILVGGKTQHISVIQYAVKGEPQIITVRQAIDLIKSGTQGAGEYYVKGTVCKIQEIDTGSYGNATYFLSDDGTYGDGNWLEVYRGYWFNGEKFTSADAFSVGDELTIVGVLIDYNGTPETNQYTASVVAITKSLLSVKEESYKMPRQGGEAEVKVVYKGEGLSVNPQVDWISLGDINVTKDTTFVTLKVAENTGDPRTGTVELTSSIPGQSSLSTITVSQAGVVGTLATPFTVSQVIEYCKDLGSGNTSSEQFYIKGKVSRIANNGAFGAQYGNGTFWISEDGEFHGEDDKTADKSLDFEVYRALWLGNVKWVEGNRQIEVGDEVIICGNVTNYNGLAETASGKNYIYSINGVTDNMTGEGTVENPFNVAAAISLCNKLGKATDDDYYVSGIVSKVVEAFSSNYGNGTFWISDDGKFNNDLSKDFEAYRILWLGNQKWAEGNDQVKVGDKVILCGQFTYYKGTCETNSGKAWVSSVTPAN